LARGGSTAAAVLHLLETESLQPRSFTPEVLCSMGSLTYRNSFASRDLAVDLR